MACRKLSHAFTLIELLIVVAIIAILAAIAVPNFLEAQVRSKVSRTMADLRSLATAIESYATDNNGPPIDGYIVGDAQAFWYVPGGPTKPGGVAGVSSPIAYMTSVKLIDPFRTVVDATAAKTADAPDSQYFEVADYRRYRYINHAYTFHGLPSTTLGSMRRVYFEVYGTWRLVGLGPQRGFVIDTVTVPGISPPSIDLNPIYDPTNGTVSRGNVVRSQKFPLQPGPHGTGF